MPRVAAIVPAYNEEETIGEVVRALLATPEVEEILVVSDGSDDETVSVARSLGVKTIHLRQNQGKGVALAVGVEHTDAPILLFLDGDILNLTGPVIRQLLEPVLSGRSEMSIGVRNRGRLLNTIHRRIGPFLSGLRCLRREVFAAVPDACLAGYRIETALNWTCARLGLTMTTTVLYDLRHRVKEKKRGWLAGTRARWSMFSSVFAAAVWLRWVEPPLRSRPSPAAHPELEYINF